jgi:CheY-like chemotaxis protein
MADQRNDNPRVLVADPDAETAAMVARQLEWAGYAVTTTGDGDEALDLAASERLDAVVLEAKMDGLTGYEVVRRLREDPRNRLMPVVMISARAGKLDRDFAFTVGADEYVKKPFLCSELVARLASLVPTDSKPAPAARPIARPWRPAAPRTPVPALVSR